MFSQSSSVNRHLAEKHYRIKKYRCDLCYHVYARKSYLLSHQRFVHGVIWSSEPSTKPDEALLTNIDPLLKYKTE